MKKKNKMSAEVLEQLEEQHPQMAEEVKKRMDADGRVEIRDEVWNRQDEEKGVELPEIVETGLTIGDLMGMFGKSRK